ncbi:glycosyltransferase [Algoriphagus sp. Y33]|uniref:glycosyltransferase n=1 Tax=Algoriphagus sp. Y33 TaxID=2772483 RepID=UPI00178235DB|nr:glycosyltransferase [Algoriphagus sp. Y33]
MVLIDFVLLAVSMLLLFYASFVSISILVVALQTARATGELPAGNQEVDIACVITAYKDVEIALPLIASILAQSHADFHIYLIADRCLPHPDLPVDGRLTVHYPETALNSKLASLKRGLDLRVRPHDAVLVLDPDNLLHPDCLRYLAISFGEGNKAVQGRRTAKNLDTTLACLDALGEIYYNFIHKELPYLLGSSAVIAGSGMLIEMDIFEQYLADFDLNNPSIILAEDKILQNKLVGRGYKIAYQKSALIFDEKSSHGDQVQKQRTRWLKSYFDHLKDVWSLLWAKLAKLEWNGIYFALMTSTPPLIFLAGGLVLTLSYGLLTNPLVLLISLVVVCLTATNWVMALVCSHTPLLIWKALPFVPVFAGIQVLSLFGFKAVKSDFGVTKHDKLLTFDQVWQERKNDFPDLKK